MTHNPSQHNIATIRQLLLPTFQRKLKGCTVMRPSKEVIK
jgi:hypothetical protein